MKSIKNAILFFTLPAFILFACAKENSEDNLPGNKENKQKGQMIVKLTDEYAGLYAPTNDPSYRNLFDEVNIDIQQVSVHYSKIEGDTASMEGWMELETNADIYDLIEISNLMVVLANGNSLPPGHIDQMRLLLGTNNTVVVDSISYELKTPSAQQSGLKVKADFTVLPGMQYDILLDFDSDASIVIQGNGNFLLKPVIRIASIVATDPHPNDDDIAMESLSNPYD